MALQSLSTGSAEFPSSGDNLVRISVLGIRVGGNMSLMMSGVDRGVEPEWGPSGAGRRPFRRFSSWPAEGRVKRGTTREIWMMLKSLKINHEQIRELIFNTKSQS